MQPSCHANHAPPYLAKVPELKAKGVDVVAVVSANDPFVLSGWSRILGFGDKILALSDPDAKWYSSLGLDVDLSGLGIGLGKRTTRYAVVLDDLKIKYLGVSAIPLFFCRWELIYDCRLSLTRPRSLSRVSMRSWPRSEELTRCK